MWISIFYFFMVVWGLGVGMARFVNEPVNFIERNVLRIGFGLGSFSLIAVVLNLIGIPLHWAVFLGLGLAGPVILIISKKGQIFHPGSFKISGLDIAFLCIFICSAVLLGVYLKGAFAYPYLEDDDSWHHSIGAKYVAVYQTYSIPFDPNNFSRLYIEPYPPAYDVLMGILHQTNSSIRQTLKVFNSLLIALGILFSFLFFKEFMQSYKKGLVASGILVILPCFMSHFIWAQTLAVILFFPAFYCLVKIKESKRWVLPAGMIISAIAVSQPSSAAIFGALALLYFFSLLLYNWLNKKKIISAEIAGLAFAGVLGLALSGIYWIPTFVKFGFEITMEGIGIMGGKVFTDKAVDTSAGLVYTLKDFAIAPLISKMDQPTGVGIVLFLLLVFSVVVLLIKYRYSITKLGIVASFFWFAFSILGLESNAFPLKLFPHRFWVFFSIPLAVLSSEGVSMVWHWFQKKRVLTYLMAAGLLAGIVITSGYPKYVVETSSWPPGILWRSADELNGYSWMSENLEKNSAVLNLCSGDEKVIGSDMFAPPLDTDTALFKRGIKEKSAGQIYDFTKGKDFEYIIADISCTGVMSVNETNAKIREINAEISKFRLKYSNKQFYLFRILN